MIKGLIKARRTQQVPRLVSVLQADKLRMDEMFVRTLLNNRNEEVKSAMCSLRGNNMFMTEEVAQLVEHM